jgi:hypothetical protein
VLPLRTAEGRVKVPLVPFRADSQRKPPILAFAPVTPLRSEPTVPVALRGRVLAVHDIFQEVLSNQGVRRELHLGKINTLSLAGPPAVHQRGQYGARRANA